MLATIPACIFGLFMKDIIELYLRSAWVIAATTIFFGLLLWWVDTRATQQDNEYQADWKRSLFIGLAQAAAMIPGDLSLGGHHDGGASSGLYP